MRSLRYAEAARRIADRRRREDQALRLHAEVPTLEELDLELSERIGSVTDPARTYRRRIVVAFAPALFEIPCGDPSCKDGGHDLTNSVMRALYDHRSSFDGENACRGSIGSASCTRSLRFHATATYAPPAHA